MKNESVKKIHAKKGVMTQIWNNDAVIPVTSVLYADEKEIGELKIGDKVNVSGRSKGKGFQGVVKRHGFAGGPKTHGQKNRLRAPGSIGATAPQRTIKGRKMAGRMGNERVTVRNLRVADVRQSEKTILLKGAIPGIRGARVEIRQKKKTA
ncbi:50S ribosomal protein L3 [Candidatus Jorgensenbacteria bacterium RIFCSPLOWO2_02_FULL_45_12]|uniref:50S ribosomal protein L3 n=2 Tax=Candidatus Joergenseniibacteriota TaxID=1752739 RepID=A0A1F6BQY3_9BACT|nr:MAG: 50S ribosomal protein L3 [Candidatus Jorgensenbacteria bacterium GW2011_GWA2_45_9]OGG38957.1 MAG: 50S ribosomal protein L3 [Candidatus Jorgensenbacteria bacterium RIFCSPHIGHO2_02_FULL_45_20]OGG42716.1 MAG: 50S ribosomal protein L3 [Candidatus Jorgensenbacteria bacterium RIFCSPLOWO2_02_FULL_45_12]